MLVRSVTNARNNNVNSSSSTEKNFSFASNWLRCRQKLVPFASSRVCGVATAKSFNFVI